MASWWKWSMKVFEHAVLPRLFAKFRMLTRREAWIGTPGRWLLFILGVEKHRRARQRQWPYALRQCLRCLHHRRLFLDSLQRSQQYQVRWGWKVSQVLRNRPRWAGRKAWKHVFAVEALEWFQVSAILSSSSSSGVDSSKCSHEQGPRRSPTQKRRVYPNWVCSPPNDSSMQRWSEDRSMTVHESGGTDYVIQSTSQTFEVGGLEGMWVW